MNPVTGALLGHGTTFAIGTLVPGTGDPRATACARPATAPRSTTTSGRSSPMRRASVSAYDLTGNQQVVLRGSYGLFFDRPDGNSVFSQVGNYPFTETPELRWSTLADVASGGRHGRPDDRRAAARDLRVREPDPEVAPVEHGRADLAAVRRRRSTCPTSGSARRIGSSASTSTRSTSGRPSCRRTRTRRSAPTVDGTNVERDCAPAAVPRTRSSTRTPGRQWRNVPLHPGVVPAPVQPRSGVRRELHVHDQRHAEHRAEARALHRRRGCDPVPRTCGSGAWPRKCSVTSGPIKHILRANSVWDLPDYERHETTVPEGPRRSSANGLAVVRCLASSERRRLQSGLPVPHLGRWSTGTAS